MIRHMRNDKELMEMKEMWIKNTDKPFLPYNYDEYNGILDYKETIRNETARDIFEKFKLGL